jgi:hypothetical protein
MAQYRGRLQSFRKMLICTFPPRMLKQYIHSLEAPQAFFLEIIMKIRRHKATLGKLQGQMKWT